MKKTPLLARQMIYPFCLVTTLFALWGFANDVTNPLVKAFQQIFLISAAESGLVQTAFYGGYATMAIPAALFIRKFSYKSGILVGLGLYATGALLFIPAAGEMEFTLFLIALYILTFGLAFLETTANPYILSMGPPETATQRLNLAQAFNPVGSLIGMVVASHLVLAQLNVSEFRTEQMELHPEYSEMLPGEVDAEITASLHDFAETSPEEHAQFRSEDLSTIKAPYVAIAGVVLLTFLAFAVSRFPKNTEEGKTLHFFGTVKRLVSTPHYIFGVLTQVFYVGAQIMCWTFIIHYAMGTLGMSASQAQNYNIVAMILFVSSRFLCTFLLRFLNPGLLLGIFACLGVLLTLGVIFIPGMPGLYCLIGISICMSLMFPTIYGISLEGMGQDAKLGSAGLIFAIVGGALMPPLQGRIIDAGSIEIGGLIIAGVRASFILPLICFVVVAIFGFFNTRKAT
ncbi:L-fucose:H+ symporter permease [Puniceicoccus vermicola]|uniref:L-fucose:H+ symporter permease n=1 Tax=Puniceicoccus vermicola TaxID=388746 RepID=A0A7X1AVF0_9BACT|nr:L-fucose:H+ symporter permease [Puniceicoccus vermicola]MBC2600731.1 L-fucose:H+ symporter permease [Puniceicoccus vermicola]